MMRAHICIRKILTFKHAEGSNLPTSLSTQKEEVSKATFSGKACLVAVSSGKLNLSQAKKNTSMAWNIRPL